MNYSKYQTSIFEFVETKTGNLIVEAVAGSGKTTTIVEVARRLPIIHESLFVAFNRHIAEALKRKLPPNVQASTLNSFGWKICRQHVRNLGYKVEPDKTQNIYKTFFDMNDKQSRGRYYQTKGVTVRLVSLFKAHYMTTTPGPDGIIEMAERYGLDLPSRDAEDYLEKLQMTYDKCKAYTSFMDYDDQLFMPLYLNLPVPTYDEVIVDEGQDLNHVQQLLVQKAGRRIIVVGDTRQAIYGFRGADPKSMENMKRKINATELPLSICYRCPRKVVELAQKIVPHIEPAPDAKDGVVETISSAAFESKVTDADYVLCRCTAPLVSSCLGFIRKGRKASVRGRDIGFQLIGLIDNLSGGSDSQSIGEFRSALNEYRMLQTDRLQRLEKEAELAALADRIDTIEVLMERSDIVGDLKREIDSIFKDEYTSPDGTVVKIPGIVFCTVHRSKGLEAPRIFIIEPKLMPHKAAKNEEQKLQEQNLMYVAYTRALGELYFVEDQK